MVNIELFKTYMRNIAVYLIFDAFIGIILPSDKYKKYISLVSGFVLILIMLTPINNFFAHSYNYNSLRDKNFNNKYIEEVQNESIKKQISEIAKNINVKVLDIEIKNRDGASEISGLEIKLANDFINGADEKKFKNTLCLLYNLENYEINLEHEKN